MIGIQFLQSEISGQIENHIIATIGGEVVGYVGLRTCNHSATFAKLFVKQSFRWKKEGTELVSRCCEFAQQKGCKTLGAVVEVTNLDVLPFYSGLGFIIAYQYEDGDLVITKQL
jgi:N-acetylglutamate synthase-like GNAT family acetyltransferase